MTLQEKIQKKAEEYGNLAPVFLEGANFALNNQWISVDEDLPCNHEELWVMTGKLMYTKKVLVVLTDNTVKALSMLYDEANDEWKWESILRDKIKF